MTSRQPGVVVSVLDAIRLEAHGAKNAKRAILAFFGLGALALLLWKGDEAGAFFGSGLAWVWGGIWENFLSPIVRFALRSTIILLVLLAIALALILGERHSAGTNVLGSEARANPTLWLVVLAALAMVIALAWPQ